MAASLSPNPLISSQTTASQLQAVLHPLVLLTISDYITRHTLRESNGPIIGALLGQQDGRDITIEHAFECHTRAANVDGGYLLDDQKFSARLEQMTTVHKDRRLEFVGWYTLLPSTGPSPTILPIHTQVLNGWNESAVLLGFHPEEVLHHSVGRKLPLTIYESNYEVDDTKTDADGEDRKMDDGVESPLKLRFREVPYTVETDETEMISMNYVAGSGGSAAAAPAKEERPARSIESNGKGKRRLVESESEETKEAPMEDAVTLNREEEDMVASLTTRANAIKMLHSRIQLITTYLERLPPSFIHGEKAESESMDTDHTTPSLTVLRQIQALVNRLDLVIPSDKEAFEKEVECETNDVHLVGLLATIMQGINQARDVSKKFNAIEANKPANRRGQTDFAGGIQFPLSVGDIVI